MANPDFALSRAVTPDFPKTEDLNRNIEQAEIAVDEPFRDIDVTSIVRTSGFITQVVYTDGSKTMTVDWTRTENNQITSIASTVS